MKLGSTSTSHEQANLDLAKDALFSAAPCFSTLSEKLQLLETSVRALHQNDKFLNELDTIEEYNTLNRAFMQFTKALHQHSKLQLKSADATFTLMKRGMSRPGVTLSSRDRALALKASSSPHQLLPMLNSLNELVDGSETPEMRKVQRDLNDCISYINNELIPTLEKHRVPERLAIVADSSIRQKVLSNAIGMGLLLVSSGGFLTKTDQKSEAINLIGGGILLTAAGATGKYKIRKEAGEEPSPSSGPYR